MRSITNQTQILEHELPNKIHYPISTYINIQLSLHSQFWHRGTCAVCNMWPSRRRLWDQLSPQSFCFSEENWKSLWDKTEETSRLHNIWLCLKIAYQQILLSIILFPCISRKKFHPLPSGTMQLPLKILRFQATLVVGAKQETTEQQLSLPRSSSLRQITGLHGTTSFWIMLGLLCYNTSPLCPLHITIYGNFSVENRHSLLVQIAASAKQRNMTKSPLDEEHQTLDTSKFEHCVLFCSS